MNTLTEFMSQYKAQPSDITTNVSLPPKPGKWSIPNEDGIYDEF